MTKDELNKEKDKLFNERFEKAQKITEEAKKNGTWKMGLDSNKELFKDLDNEYFQKAQELWKRYQREKED